MGPGGCTRVLIHRLMDTQTHKTNYKCIRFTTGIRPLVNNCMVLYTSHLNSREFQCLSHSNNHVILQFKYDWWKDLYFGITTCMYTSNRMFLKPNLISHYISLNDIIWPVLQDHWLVSLNYQGHAKLYWPPIKLILINSGSPKFIESGYFCSAQSPD